MSSRPKVSLAIPVYNGANFIGDAIESILAQSFKDFELIITDNASTDETQAIVESFAHSDARIKYIRNPKNVGAAPNYNLGFEHASGEYFKWHAHDDTLSENFLEVCVKTLDADPSVSIVQGKTRGLDPQGNISPLVGSEASPVLSDLPGERFSETLEYTHDCFHIFGLMRHDLLAKTGLQKLYYGTDRGLLAEMAILGKLVVAEEATFYNREHGSRSVNLQSNMQRAVWHNGSTNRFGAAERINLTLHLFEIAARHPDVVSPWGIRSRALAFAIRPSALKRYAIEIADMTMPSLANYLRSKKTPAASKVA